MLSGRKYPKSINNASIGYVTKGWPNTCSFCAINRLEPNFIDYIPLKNQIDQNKKDLILLDNNVLASKEFSVIVDENN